MAFGLGFVLGPLLGGVLISLPISPAWRLRLPFLVAAGFSTLAWFLVLFRLPESIRKDAPAREAARVLSWRGLVDTITLPGIGSLILLGFLSIMAFAALEGTMALFLRRRMEWEPQSAAFAFAGLGLLSAMVQGGLIRRLVPRYGEPKLIGAGIAVVAMGFAGLALISNTLELAGALFLVGVGQGLLGPSISGMLSRLTPASEQGAVFGTFSSVQTVARMISYSLANVLLAWSDRRPILVRLRRVPRGGGGGCLGSGPPERPTSADSLGRVRRIRRVRRRGGVSIRPIIASACNPGLQVEDHVPEAVDLSTLDDLKWLEAFEGVVRRVEPDRDRVRRHDFGEPVAEAIQLPDPSEPRFAHRLPALPVRNRSLGEPGEPGEHLAADTELPTDRAYRQRFARTEYIRAPDQLARKGLLLRRHENLHCHYSRGSGQHQESACRFA